jgi:hypothetical protein
MRPVQSWGIAKVSKPKINWLMLRYPCNMRPVQGWGIAKVSKPKINWLMLRYPNNMRPVQSWGIAKMVVNEFRRWHFLA